MKSVSRLMAIFLLLGLWVTASSSCGKNSKVEISAQGSTQLGKTYENEFFSIEYPADWAYEEEINNMCDTVPAMSKGINVVVYNQNRQSRWPIVRVQKSSMFDCFNTPEEWRDLSTELKQFDDNYIGTVDEYMLDSLQFGNLPAAMAGFAFLADDGDAVVVQKQLVVMVGKEVYYLNNIFDMNDDGTMESAGDAILKTVRFKHEK